MNVALTFEVLLYLNSYYFGLFTVFEVAMHLVKSFNMSLPYFGADMGILAIVCVLELIRVVIARKGNFTEKCWPVLLAIIFTIPSAVGVVYFLMWQSVIIRMEYIICAIQLGLQAAEIFFGILVLLPVCKTPEYY